MRPEVWQVVSRTEPVVLVTGDTGTGKSSVLQATIAEYAGTVVAPPLSVCLFDSGALQNALFDALATVLAIAGPGQAKWRDLAKRLQHATREAAVEVGRALADAVVEEVVEFAKTKLGQKRREGLTEVLDDAEEGHRSGVETVTPCAVGHQRAPAACANGRRGSCSRRSRHRHNVG